jgi:hypothetical protein
MRQDHPIGLNVPQNLNSIGSVSLTGWGSTSIMFDFTGVKIPVSSKLILGFGMNCANDVVYEKIILTPEPTTVFLLGSGLLGLVALGRKRFRK